MSKYLHFYSFFYNKYPYSQLGVIVSVYSSVSNTCLSTIFELCDGAAWCKACQRKFQSHLKILMTTGIFKSPPPPLAGILVWQYMRGTIPNFRVNVCVPSLVCLYNWTCLGTFLNVCNSLTNKENIISEHFCLKCKIKQYWTLFMSQELC